MTTTTQTTTSEPEMISYAAYQRARALATAHGHEWTQVQPAMTFPIELSACVAAHEELLQAQDDGTRQRGIAFSLSHTTGSGRLSWEIWNDGTVDLWVRTPGERLASVRALRLAVIDADRAFPASLGDKDGDVAALARLLDALRDYAGPGLLSRIERDESKGVIVLSATVSPSGVVTCTPHYETLQADGLGGPSTRHWMTLRTTLRALGLALPVPSQIAAVFAEYDTACTQRDELAREQGWDSAEVARKRDEIERIYQGYVVVSPVEQTYPRRRRGGFRAADHLNTAPATTAEVNS